MGMAVYSDRPLSEVTIEDVRKEVRHMTGNAHSSGQAIQDCQWVAIECDANFPNAIIADLLMQPHGHEYRTSNTLHRTYFFQLSATGMMIHSSHGGVQRLVLEMPAPEPHHMGSWCSGITSASHAIGPGFKSQWVELVALRT